MGYSRKNPHPPDGWGPFLTPLSPGFPEAQDPPSRLDFREKNKRLKFNLFLMENTRKHV